MSWVFLRRCYSTNSKPVVGVLGGGISGLSAAYYMSKKFGNKVQVVLFEGSERVGGWVNTVHGSKAGMFEMGPRTIRPFGIRGLNTLDLVEEVGLDKEVLYIQRTHDVAKNRFIYLDGGLVKLPSDMSVVFKKTPPFSRPLLFAIIRDVVTRRANLPDDSIYNFVSRRFGKEIADYLTDPLIRGICSGDSKQISIKFLMRKLFDFEQAHGSVVIGALKERFGKQQCTLTEDDKSIGYSKIAASSLMGNWAVWSLDNGGLSTLTERLGDKLRESNVDLKLNCNVESVQFKDRVEISYVHNGVKDSISCDHVVSSVSSKVLGSILQHSGGVKTQCVEKLYSIPYESLQVTGLAFEGQVHSCPGFGFLVPSLEKSVGGLLGVVFDTNCFPQGDLSVLTVMSRGSVLGSVGESNQVVLSYLNKTLGISQKPVDIVSHVGTECIPQYTVGHYERVEEILGQMDSRVSVCGSWVDGVSVNDCVYGGRAVAAKVAGEILSVEEGAEHVEELKRASASS